LSNASKDDAIEPGQVPGVMGAASTFSFDQLATPAAENEFARQSIEKNKPTLIARLLAIATTRVLAAAAVLVSIISFGANFGYTVWHDNHKDKQDADSLGKFELSNASDLLLIRKNITSLKDALLTSSTGAASSIQKAMIEELKTVASDRGLSDSSAADVLTSAADVLTRLTEKKSPADTAFFSQATSTLTSIRGREATRMDASLVQARLTDYRSSLNAPVSFNPNMTGGCCDRSIQVSDSVPTGIAGQQEPRIITQGGKRLLIATLWEAKSNYGDFIVPVRAKTLVPPSSDPKIFVNNIVFVRGSQTLDHFAFRNVIFINVAIHYHGAPVLLDNVRFIDCTFDPPGQTESFDLLQAITRSPSDIPTNYKFGDWAQPATGTANGI
jgi:hypothetical protein